jgi:serine protease Do
MNKKLIWTCLSLGALSIILIALPGSSARVQDCDNTALARLQAKLQQLEAAQAVQAAPVALMAQERVSDNIELIEEEPSAEDEMQLVVGMDGSWLGVETSEVTQERAKELKLPAERGALVGKIVPNSPAAKAGLKENDVITEVNGQRVEGTAQFRRMIHEIPAGRAVQLTVWRDGRSQSVSATLGKSEARHSGGMLASPVPGAFAFRVPEMPEIAGMGDFNGFTFSTPGHARLGIDAEDLQGDFGNYFGAPDGEGVLVRDVFADSPAAKAGLKAGDVITSVNGERVRTVGELREKLQNDKDAKSVKLGVLRNKSGITLNAELPPLAQKQIHFKTQRTNI